MEYNSISDFCLTIKLSEAILISMDKEKIKKILLDAVKNSPYLEAIKSVAIFGSYVNGTPSSDSDIDVLIDFEPSAVIGFFALSDIKNNFESFLKRSVDLLTPAAISKYFRDEVVNQAETVYEKR